jgi:putative membrane protein
MKLRYSAVAAALVGFLLPSITMAQPDERYWGPGMMWGGGLFHMFFGFLMMILFLAIVVGVVVLLVRWLGSEHSLLRPTGQTSRTALDILKERLARARSMLLSSRSGGVLWVNSSALEGMLVEIDVIAVVPR